MSALRNGNVRVGPVTRFRYTTTLPGQQGDQGPQGPPMPRQGVDALADSNVTLSGLQTIDGVSLAAGQCVLLTAQTGGVTNGFWIVQSGVWVRPPDFANSLHVAGVTVIVLGGSQYANQEWYCTSQTPNDIVGTSALAFAAFDYENLPGSGANEYTGSGKIAKINATQTKLVGDPKLLSDAVDGRCNTASSSSWTTIFTIPVPSTGTGRRSVTVWGSDSGDNTATKGSWSANAEFCAVQNGSGGVRLDQAASNPSGIITGGNTISGVGLQLVTSGTNVLVQVKGIGTGGANIEWGGFLQDGRRLH